MHAYSNASWAGDYDTRQSTNMGTISFLGVTWISRLLSKK